MSNSNDDDDNDEQDNYENFFLQDIKWILRHCQRKLIKKISGNQSFYKFSYRPCLHACALFTALWNTPAFSLICKTPRIFIGNCVFLLLQLLASLNPWALAWFLTAFQEFGRGIHQFAKWICPHSVSTFATLNWIVALSSILLHKMHLPGCCGRKYRSFGNEERMHLWNESLLFYGWVQFPGFMIYPPRSLIAINVLFISQRTKTK